MGTYSRGGGLFENGGLLEDLRYAKSNQVRSFLSYNILKNLTLSVINSYRRRLHLIMHWNIEILTD